MCNDLKKFIRPSATSSECLLMATMKNREQVYPFYLKPSSNSRFFPPFLYWFQTWRFYRLFYVRLWLAHGVDFSLHFHCIQNKQHSKWNFLQISFLLRGIFFFHFCSSDSVIHAMAMKFQSTCAIKWYSIRILPVIQKVLTYKYTHWHWSEVFFFGVWLYLILLCVPKTNISKHLWVCMKLLTRSKLPISVKLFVLQEKNIYRAD